MATTARVRTTAPTTKRKSHKPRKPQRHYTDLPIDPTAEYLGRLQAARLFGVNVQTIDAMIKPEIRTENKKKKKPNPNPLPAYRFGRRVLVKRADLMQRLEPVG